MQPRWPVKRLARALAASLMLAGVVTGIVPAAASAATCQSWTGAIDSLSAVRAVSASDVWAVGASSNGTVDKTLILHWNGHKWATVTSPSPGTASSLSGVAATSAQNVWAVGESETISTEQTLILHWDGHTWTTVPSPSPSPVATLAAVGASSANNAWAVGASGGGPDATLILHWNGHTWAKVTSPNAGGPGGGNLLSGVAVTAGSNAWAVGLYHSAGSTVTNVLLLHWNGQSWQAVPGPNPGTTSNMLSAVAATSSGNVWTVGQYASGGAIQALAFHCC